MSGVADVAEDRHSLSRVTALTDGVFAIALTVLVLQITVPRIPDARSTAQLRAALGRQEGQFVSYAVTFLVIAAFWHQHRRLFRLTTGHDETATRLNTFFLLLIAFLPFPSALLGRYGDNATAIVFFDLAVIAAGLVFSLLWLRLRRSGRLGGVSGPYRNWVLARTVVVCVVLVVSAAIAPFSTGAAAYLWLGIPPLLLLAYLRYRPAIRLADRAQDDADDGTGAGRGRRRGPSVR